MTTSPKDNLKNLKYTWHYLKPYGWELVRALCALSVAAVIILGLGQVVRVLIDQNLHSPNSSLFTRSIIVFAFLSIVLALATYVRTSTTAWMAERVVSDLKAKLFNHLLTMDLIFYEKQRLGDLLARLNGDATLIRTVVAASGAVAIRSTIQLFGSLIFLVITSPRLLLVILATIPVVLIPIFLIGRSLKNVSKESQDQLGLVNAFEEEKLMAIKDVQILHAEAETDKAHKALLLESLGFSKRRVHKRSLLIASVIGLAFLAVGLVAWVGANDVYAGAMTAGELAAFIFYAIVATGSLNSLAEVIGDIQASSGAMERILSVMATSSLIRDPKAPQVIPPSSKVTITIKNLTFFYPSRPEKPALKGVNLQVIGGQHIALVGPSGAGKSTLFQLLLRFYDPQQGSINLSGIPLDQLSLETVRSKIGIVPQDPVIFNDTVFNNIWFANPKASRKSVLEAAKAAYVHEFSESLPQGYDTVLGERGVKLSGGQRQRIAIARALLKSPQILLLDEATNALDALKEHYVQMAIEELMKDRTTIIAAHRLTTVKKADNIIVLDRGEIVATGQHEALVKAKGLYYDLAQKQLIA